MAVHCFDCIETKNAVKSNAFIFDVKFENIISSVVSIECAHDERSASRKEKHDVCANPPSLDYYSACSGVFLRLSEGIPAHLM